MQTIFKFHGENQIHDVRPTAKKLAMDMGFGSNNSYSIASTISELIQSVSAIGKDYRIALRVVKNTRNYGIELTINALTENKYKNNFSINGHLGSGFENIKRRMDDFCISSSGGELKLVTTKWISIA